MHEVCQNADSWMRFLTTAANNYKYRFKDQILIYAQKPNATACAEIETWNKLGRWINKGTRGIALLIDCDVQYRLRHVFDIADTNSYYGNNVMLWLMNERYESMVTEALINSFGEIESDRHFTEVLISTAENVVMDNIPDYLEQLKAAKGTSFLSDLDDFNIEVVFKKTLVNSVAFMLIERCGFEGKEFFGHDAFSELYQFCSSETVSVLGGAASDISEMVLREIAETVKIAERQEKSTNYTFANPPSKKDNIITNKESERSGQNEYHLHESGRLPDTRPDSTRKPEWNWEVWDATPDISQRPQGRSLHRDADDEQAERSPSGDRQTGNRDDGGADSETVEASGSEREAQGRGPDALGSVNEQHSQSSRRNSPKGDSLPLSGFTDYFRTEVDYFHEDAEKNELIRNCPQLNDHRVEIATFFKSQSDNKERGNFLRSFFDEKPYQTTLSNGLGTGFKAYSDCIHLWCGVSFDTREKDAIYRWEHLANRVYGMMLIREWLEENEPVLLTEDEQIQFIENNSKLKSQEFSIPQEAIDYVLIKGSGISQGKFRIYEQISKKETTDKNIDFLKGEYGMGGSSDAIPGTGYWVNYDAKGIAIENWHSVGDKQVFLLTWSAAEKRIKQLIATDRYLSDRDKEKYPEYIREKFSCDERSAVAVEFISIITDFNDYMTQLGETEKCLNTYELKVCCTNFTYSGKNAFVHSENQFVLPLMRKAMETVIEENTHLTGRCQAMLVMLSGERENELETTIEELTPEPELPKEYKFSLGDSVHIGIDEYDILSMDVDTVLLFDSKFPILNKEMSRQEFDVKIAENPMNDKYLQTIEEIPQKHSVGYEDAIFIDEQNKRGFPLHITDKYTEKLENNGHPVIFYNEDEPNLLNEAKRQIDKFCREEYEHDDGADYSDLSNVGVAYTETEDGEHEIQASVDLVNFSINTYVDGILARGEDYDNIEYMVRSILPALNFSDLTYVSDDELEYVLSKKQSEIVLEPPKTQIKDKVGLSILYPEIKSVERNNFRITDDKIGVGTPSVRYANNVAAIKILKQLEKEERLATAEEQKILSQYVGWGGLSDCFSEGNAHYGELKELLTDDEYNSAKESTLTAFYTPPVVICAIYHALENMNFKVGNILEPSCGVGNFLGMIPESMGESKLYAIEMDSVSGQIAQQLYQKSSVSISPFEKTALPDSFFDAAIGNVPFGQFKVADKKYDKNNFLIHDYFFARTLDKVRPGGIIAFITSQGTMDKENPAVRKYIAQRADLIGAIRLPNNTFKSAAGTEVTSDIIFLQKRDRLLDIKPDWVHLNTDENGIKMNEYFVNNPDMVCGEMKMISGPYGEQSACVAFTDRDLSDLLNDAIQNIHAEVVTYGLDDISEDETDLSIPADPNVRNFSYYVVDGKVYYRENSRMNPKELSVTAENRVKGLVEIRDCVRKLIEYQSDDYPDGIIETEQKKLNDLYDNFQKKYGIINDRANNSVFSDDSSYCLICSLEVLDDEGNFVRKADMFSKRTIRQRVVVTSVDTASEALSVSLSEKAKIDMSYMIELTGKTENELYSDLKGVIFLNPENIGELDGKQKYLTADEYLSGNVREKLELAKNSFKLYPEDYAENVKALEAVQPTDLTASEISVRLGATWLPTEVVEKFMYELFETPRWCQWNVKVHYSEYSGEWNVEGKSYDRGNIKANNTYGTSRINGYKIIEETLNLRDVRIFDYVEDENGRKTAILNRKETAIAQGKQEIIRQDFADWIWNEPNRREKLCKLYNTKFNSNRAREYDGSFLNFVGMNPEITLRPHQINAIARILLGGNSLLAHVVGAGKTFEMVASAQESKRLGLCNKSLFVVPNHLTEQWASEYLQLYPTANILVATKKDFETKNRKKFCGRIATGDYDAIIIGHSQFEKIPMSVERQHIILERQLDEITNGIIELKHNRGDGFSVKQLEKAKKTIKQKLEKLNDQSRKDDVVTFEELGVDRIFIDEAHYYKNLASFTKMRNVGGISQTEAMKSSDLYMKCRYLDEMTDGKGVVFATGTPISNSMVEMFTMQKYLQNKALKDNNLLHFDSWASTFGETVTAIELAPEGTGYRAKTRFAKFYNLPELIIMFRDVADIQTADMLNLPVPKANYHTVALKPSEEQKEMVASLAERAEKVRNKMVASNLDNMLCITNDGRKLALDQRLLNELLPDSEASKVTA